MAQSLTERLALRLQPLAGIDVIFPGSGELLRAIYDCRPPGFAIGHQYTQDWARDSDPSSAVIGDGDSGLVIAAQSIADLLCDVADIGDAAAVELRPIVDRHDDVGPGRRLDRRGNARLDAVPLDRLDI